MYFNNFCAIDMNIWDLRGRQKQTFQKIAVSTMTNDFGPYFLVPSSVTNIAKQCIGIGKVFWQLLWNLKEHCLGP